MINKGRASLTFKNVSLNTGHVGSYYLHFLIRKKKKKTQRANFFPKGTERDRIRNKTVSARSCISCVCKTIKNCIFNCSTNVAFLPHILLSSLTTVQVCMKEETKCSIPTKCLFFHSYYSIEPEGLTTSVV